LWFGFEQEYFLYKDGRPLGFPSGYPAPQGPYYTGVGYKNVGSIAREIVEEHLDLCLAAGINHEGINAEVAKGQWEFQIFGKGSKKAADEMWMARYLMHAPLREVRQSTSNSTASRSATPTGTAPACTPTSRPSTCAKSAARSTSKS
jgi:glutamine synthetase